jgi:hypothetical protein
MYVAIVSRNTVLTSADETISQPDSTELRIEQIYKVVNNEHMQYMKELFPLINYDHVFVESSDPGYQAFRNADGEIQVIKGEDTIKSRITSLEESYTGLLQRVEQLENT